MNRVLALILAWSIALLGTGAGQFAHERVAHGDAAGHVADHHESHGGSHDADHDAIAHEGHSHDGDHDAPPEGHSHRSKASCTVCQALALIGKTAHAPPAAVALPAAAAPLLRAMPGPIVAGPYFTHASPTAAPRGPPLV